MHFGVSPSLPSHCEYTAHRPCSLWVFATSAPSVVRPFYVNSRYLDRAPCGTLQARRLLYPRRLHHGLRDIPILRSRQYLAISPLRALPRALQSITKSAFSVRRHGSFGTLQPRPCSLWDFATSTLLPVGLCNLCAFCNLDAYTKTSGTHQSGDLDDTSRFQHFEPCHVRFGRSRRDLVTSPLRALPHVSSAPTSSPSGRTNG